LSSALNVMPAYLSSRLSSLDGDDGDERASPFQNLRMKKNSSRWLEFFTFVLRAEPAII